VPFGSRQRSRAHRKYFRQLLLDFGFGPLAERVRLEKQFVNAVSATRSKQSKRLFDNGVLARDRLQGEKRLREDDRRTS
jgi:hypothetical protein